MACLRDLHLRARLIRHWKSPHHCCFSLIRQWDIPMSIDEEQSYDGSDDVVLHSTLRKSSDTADIRRRLPPRRLPGPLSRAYVQSAAAWSHRSRAGPQNMDIETDVDPMAEAAPAVVPPSEAPAGLQSARAPGPPSGFQG